MRLGSLQLLLMIAVGAVALRAQPVVVTAPDAPKAIGPYSQAVVAGNMVFVSGQLGMAPGTRELVSDDVREQTDRALRNIEAILKAAGCSMSDVVSCTVYLKDMNDFAAMNEVYAKFFPDNPPARATVEVARLPKDALVEISCIAVKP